MHIHISLNWVIIHHYSDVIIGAMASQITSLAIVYSNVNSGTDQRKHQSTASLAFVWGIHRWPVNSPHKWPVTRKMFPFDDVIMGSDHGLLLVLSHTIMMEVMTSWKCFLHYWPIVWFGIDLLVIWVSMMLRWHHCNAYMFNVRWTRRNKLNINLNQNIKVFFQKSHWKFHLYIWSHLSESQFINLPVLWHQ